MKNTLILFISSLVYISGCSQNRVIEKKQFDTSEKIKVLFDFAEGKYYSEIDEKRFLNAFPDHLEEYKKIYNNPVNIKNTQEYLPLNYHLNLLSFGLKSVEEVDIIKKLIDVSLNARWVDDAVIDLQFLLYKKIPESLNETVSVLMKKDKLSNLSFWRFYFDGPHPENLRRDYKQLYSRILQIDQRTANLMKKSYEQLLSESDEHGH